MRIARQSVSRFLLAVAVVGLSVTSAFAADWPWVYGPRTEQHLRSEGPAAHLAAGRPEGALDGARWASASAARPSATARSTCSTGTRRSGDKLRVLDLASGKELWSFAYDAPGSFMFAGSRTTPTVDGERVYTVGPLGDLYAINTKTQKPVWHKNIWKDFGGGELPRWAIVQHPLIYGDLLIVAPQTSEAGVVAYDKLTGELKWKSAPLSGIPGYVSPSIVKIGGEDHLVMVMASRGTRPHRQGRQRQRPRSAQRQGAVDLHGLAVHHPGSPAGRRRRRPRADHGRVQRRHRDVQGREEGGRQLRASPSCSRIPTSAPTRSRRSCTRTTSTPTTRSTSAATGSSR